LKRYRKREFEALKRMVRLRMQKKTVEGARISSYTGEDLKRS